MERVRSDETEAGHFGAPSGPLGKLMLALLGTVTVWRKGKPLERERKGRA